ncbi:hypothetical protein [Nitrogeniibacter aestuarii]|nr:hypothetical protein [Nitrogeniibacter aestuarii]
MQTLVGKFMHPVIPPEDEYIPLEHTILYRSNLTKDIVLEIFQRKNNTYGFRYQAWVGWRDAGDNVRSHSWTEIDPGSNIITDSLETIKNEAEANANEKGIDFEAGWINGT